MSDSWRCAIIRLAPVRQLVMSTTKPKKTVRNKKTHEEIKCFDADPAALTELMRAPVTHHNGVEAVRV